MTLDPQSVGPEDARHLRTLGVTRQAVEDALMVAFCFNIITRLADAFGWHIPEQSSFDASAKYLLAQGYRLPMRTEWTSQLEPEGAQEAPVAVTD